MALINAIAPSQANELGVRVGRAASLRFGAHELPSPAHTTCDRQATATATDGHSVTLRETYRRH